MLSEQELAQRLSACGLRPTQQRLLVYRFLLEHRVHPCADTIYDGLAAEYPSLSRTTVYNSLHALERVGLIRRIPVDEQEQRYDADVRPHGHFHCRVCGAVLDFPLNRTALEALCPPELTADSVDVLFCGRCSGCLSKA